jgi:hypothetical protein
MKVIPSYLSGQTIQEEREKKRWQQRKRSHAQCAAAFHFPARASLDAFQFCCGNARE